MPLLPLDANVSSTGVVKVLDGYRDSKGEKEQLGFNAFFVPTFGGSASGTMLSQFPALDYPVLALSAYHGDLRADSGIPQSVYQLDKSKMKEFKNSEGELFKKLLMPGETMTLPNGAGSVTFEKDIKEWAGFQVVQEPGGGWALGGAVVAIAGLAGSLFIQRRRVWVRAVRGDDGVTVVEMAGLGRSESAKVPEELGDLAGILYDRAPGAPTRNRPNPPILKPCLPKGLSSSDSRRRDQREPRGDQQRADLLRDGRLHPRLLRVHRGMDLRQPQQGRPYRLRAHPAARAKRGRPSP
ncbi:hypothetical protein SHKM778_06450 [Streptomyces sp. KM77-8]|uniref:ResB-like domain-containing protein n=1 Tax=Streptomyces haneummycinicus TaxID=3074435 RepID=A0AAT9HA58_9ACTN